MGLLPASVAWWKKKREHWYKLHLLQFFLGWMSCSKIPQLFWPGPHKAPSSSAKTVTQVVTNVISLLSSFCPKVNRWHTHACQWNDLTSFRLFGIRFWPDSVKTFTKIKFNTLVLSAFAKLSHREWGASKFPSVSSDGEQATPSDPIKTARGWALCQKPDLKPGSQTGVLASTNIKTITTHLCAELSLHRHFILSTVVLPDLNYVMEKVCRL